MAKETVELGSWFVLVVELDYRTQGMENLGSALITLLRDLACLLRTLLSIACLTLSRLIAFGL